MPGDLMKHCFLDKDFNANMSTCTQKFNNKYIFSVINLLMNIKWKLYCRYFTCSLLFLEGNKYKIIDHGLKKMQI